MAEEKEQNSMPPNLETFIPVDDLPDVINVHFDFNDRLPYPYPWMRFTDSHPIKFVRQLTDKDFNGSSIDPDCPKREVLTGRLDLRCSNVIGSGNHAKVLLAPLTIPSTPSIHHAVAAKMARSSTCFDHSERDMLLEEAKIYNTFPRNLQDGEIPVVPKFYGYYAPSTEALERDDNGNNGSGNGYDLDEDEWKCVREQIESLSPILLLEACGEQVSAAHLSDSDNKAIYTLLRRLHDAGIVQGSMYERNILVQSGPLTSPCVDRSLSEPSYRIIDFGRGHYLGLNCSSLECIRASASKEREKARDNDLIPIRYQASKKIRFDGPPLESAAYFATNYNISWYEPDKYGFMR